MHLPPLAVLLAWIPLGAYMFRRYPVRVAILANFLGGWAVLPGASYIPSGEEFPYWFMGVSLPTNYFFTKATVTGLAALIGIVLFYRGDWRNFRLTRWEIPIAVWCCAPLLSVLFHPELWSVGLSGAVYQTLAWGMPWLLGRYYFAQRDGLLLAAKGIVIAGACYIPVCLVEFFTGPQIYALLYGYLPYRWIGADRYIGFRPVGLLEDGNQLGIWMAASALVAIALAARGLAPRILGLPIAWVAAALAVMTLLCQSAGSIVLLVALLPLALLESRNVLRGAVGLLIFGIVAFALFRMTNLVNLRAAARHSGLVRSIANGFGEIGRHSLVWRLARDESHMRAALQHPLLGTGEWNWWRHGDTRPWSLWLLVFGMYGLVGLTPLAAILFLPVLRTAWSRRAEQADSDPREARLRLALVALILMVAFDDLLNGAMILPYLLVMGGLLAPSPILAGTRKPLRKPPAPKSPERVGNMRVYGPVKR